MGYGQDPCEPFVGLVSCMGNVALFVVSCINLVDLNKKYEFGIAFNDGTFRENDEIMRVEDNTDKFLQHKRMQIAILAYTACMTPITVAMTIGMRKKRPHWATPWIILTGVGIIALSCNVVRTGFKLTSNQVFAEILYIVIQSLVWIPLLILWMGLRHESRQAEALTAFSGHKCSCQMQRIDEESGRPEIA